jgi:hypothetical protein
MSLSRAATWQENDVISPHHGKKKKKKNLTINNRRRGLFYDVRTAYQQGQSGLQASKMMLVIVRESRERK